MVLRINYFSPSTSPFSFKMKNHILRILFSQDFKDSPENKDKPQQESLKCETKGSRLLEETFQEGKDYHITLTKFRKLSWTEEIDHKARRGTCSQRQCSQASLGLSKPSKATGFLEFLTRR